MSTSVWALVFLMVILKIPIVYLCSVVWVAIKSKPRPGGGEGAGVREAPDWPPPGLDRLRRRPYRRPSRPHGGPVRVYARTARAAHARTGRIAGR